MKLSHYYTDQIWKNNQILVAILGICSALAVTIKVSVALTMGISVIFVTGFSSLFVSLIRSITPPNVRMIAQLAIISLFVIIVDQMLKAFLYEMSLTLSVFVGLIITNCIVMGRAESMAKNVSPLPAFLDGLGAASGYALILLIVGVIRELFGFGSILDYPIIPESWYASPEHPDRYVNSNLMALAPSAFFIIGAIIWMRNVLTKEEDL
ncbi:NADH:ubiquinone reductase (Na(+)-transporting) subunit D [Simkania negevensis]|uniref:Putative Na(+)-translocating NADH-quinone reductase subunit D n=1 Tax=Simkania negevensis (strain ATCC VR-1471 / DSM 27360 / Z) TaxID=331113 RepID=F8L4Q1_SIMNZ|nr:NADH:ubiquinone reductase (Na(+)-transporting) subunit D [Simkania negevensis]MCB1075313.1 NADH:ubiquinone reductase (Na(+)-transporting) subunit D [Simkania sp.]CCB88350.1 putative Na(+)-translocating NADH-quinone reductase subunit D [Simkania negevensis Z]